MEPKNYNRKELEELLPDYVFGRLNSEEKELFEKLIQNYPDLIQEVENVRNVFARLQCMDIDSLLDKKTRNIPFKVSQRFLERKNPLNFLTKPVFVSIVAGFGILLLIVSIIFTRTKKDMIAIHKTTERNSVAEKVSPIFPQLDDIDNLALLDDDKLSDSSQLHSEYLPSDALFSEIDYIENIVNANLVDLISDKDMFFTFPFNENLFNNLEKLDENDFQQLMEELNNVGL